MAVQGCVSCGASPAEATIHRVRVVPAELIGDLALLPGNHLPLCEACLIDWQRAGLTEKVLAAYMLVRAPKVSDWEATMFGMSGLYRRSSAGQGIPRQPMTIAELMQRDRYRCRLCLLPVKVYPPGMKLRRVPADRAERGHIVSGVSASEWEVSSLRADSPSNIVLMCHRCNGKVGVRTPNLRYGISHLIKPWRREEFTEQSALRRLKYAGMTPGREGRAVITVLSPVQLSLITGHLVAVPSEAREPV